MEVLMGICLWSMIYKWWIFPAAVFDDRRIHGWVQSIIVPSSMADTFPSSDGGTSSGISFWPFVHPMANPQSASCHTWVHHLPSHSSSAETRMVQSVNVQIDVAKPSMNVIHFCRAGNQTCSTCFVRFPQKPYIFREVPPGYQFCWSMG